MHDSLEQSHSQQGASARRTQAGKVQAEWTQQLILKKKEGGLRPCGPDPLLVVCVPGPTGLSNFGTAQSLTASFVRCSDLSVSLCVVVVPVPSAPPILAVSLSRRPAHNRPSLAAAAPPQSHCPCPCAPHSFLRRFPLRSAAPTHAAASNRSIHRSPFPPSPAPMATELTAAQLRAYDGTDPSKPIYVSVRGKVYDVSTGRGFYGPGGAYAIFAGREASRALGKMSKDEADVSGDLSGLTEKELGVLADWETKFQAKYPVVARLSDA
ncbi:hypothetical protein HU200_017107 [Digitaria exilis]|uniref:Cytochrome b5 heme-binding domain-containing protein n=1 Tax=Digitaria exilis TaxID=1010633 RepID=A0A835F6T8_9POAL|nr:hypothetical protein HU200_017107 [Digitaria exilis]